MNRAFRTSSPIPLAFDQLREGPGAVPGEIPGLLERLAEAPDPRDRRGVRHAPVVILALTACAVLAGATSLLAVGEWITDAPPSALERLGVRPDPLSPKRCLPAEATVRRLLGRIDGDALDRAVGRWLADRRAGADGQLHAVAVDGKALRGAARATGSARRPRPPLRPGPGPTRRWREDQRDPQLPASAGNPRRPEGVVVTSDAMHTQAYLKCSAASTPRSATVGSGRKGASRR
ncbi:transposase family protein [Streptomyces sp. NPDC005803]|uniref:transposase family protein n=1 Tax=Streptomyces sp. NPDC005803 TaxID=3154297 RepID=UPI0033C15723